MTSAPERRAQLGNHRISQLRPVLEASGVYERATLYYTAWFGASLAVYTLCFSVLLQQPPTGVRVLAIVGTAVAMMQLGLFGTT